MENYSKRIRICFVIDRLNFGGAERLTIQLLNYLDNNKFDKTLVYLYEPSKDFSFKYKINPDTNVIFFDIRKYGIAGRIHNLRKLLKDFDIVHSCLETSNLYCSIVNFISPGSAKFISTVHGIDFPFVNDPVLKKKYAESSLLDKFLYNYVQTFLFKLYFQFIAVCFDIKNYLINKRKINSEKIKVLYHGIELKSNTGSENFSADFKKVHSIKNSDFLIGYVGRLSFGKGLEYLIREFNSSFKNIPEAKLIFVGDGELKEYLVKYAEDNSLNNKVIFTGYQENVFDYYHLLDLFVIPSFSESTNLTVLEAMHSGLLVLSSDAGGLKEIIEDGKTGLLFKVGDFNEMTAKMLNVYANKTCLNDIKINAKKTVLGKFDISKNLPEIQKFILSIFNK